MDLSTRLRTTQHVEHPTAVVLVLHGGGSRAADVMVRATQLSVLRMIPIARALASASRELAVVRVLNSQRGWDSSPTPVDDVSWALRLVREKYGIRTRIGLVGHSLGGRAALLAVRTEQADSVVALNPFLHPGDSNGFPARTRLLVVQGTEDRVSRPERTVVAVEAIRRDADAHLALVTGGQHAMLRHHRVYTGLAVAFTRHVLLGERASGVLERLLHSDSGVVRT